MSSSLLEMETKTPLCKDGHRGENKSILAAAEHGGGGWEPPFSQVLAFLAGVLWQLEPPKAWHWLEGVRPGHFLGLHRVIGFKDAPGCSFPRGSLAAGGAAGAPTPGCLGRGVRPSGEERGVQSPLHFLARCGGAKPFWGAEPPVFQEVGCRAPFWGRTTPISSQDVEVQSPFFLG